MKTKTSYAKTQYACQQCGYISTKWIGRCPTGQEWNSFVEERPAPLGDDRPRSWDSTPVAFGEIVGSEAPRTPTGIAEFDRVLGGGVVAGALILLGDPGVGKSTLMLDVASRLSAQMKVLYASGEESAQQIKLRGSRMNIEAGNLQVYAEMSVEKILSAAESLKASVLVLDSVQTSFSEKLEMAPGSIGQVREVASQLLFWAKKTHVPVFLIVHVTKDGSLAGPKALEHIVDTVLYFEGPRQHPHRIVRTIKNRFGPANELGIFEMAGSGLRPRGKALGIVFVAIGESETGIGSCFVCGRVATLVCRDSGARVANALRRAEKTRDRSGSSTAGVASCASDMSLATTSNPLFFKCAIHPLQHVHEGSLKTATRDAARSDVGMSVSRRRLLRCVRLEVMVSSTDIPIRFLKR